MLSKGIVIFHKLTEIVSILPANPGDKFRIKLHKASVAGFLLVFGIMGFSQQAFATKKVYSPIVEGGELEFEWRGSYDFDDRDSKDGEQKQKYAVGYGVTDWWFTELYGEIEREAEQDEFDLTSIEWENRFQLTEQGQYWLDAGLYFAYETTVQNKKADKIEGKILLEKSFANFTHTANIIFEKQVGGGAEEETEAGLAWSSRYRWKEYFEPGFEWHSNFGELKEHNPYDEQKHQAGPVFSGKVGPVKYDIGYLFGITDPAPEGELKWIMEYELHF
jgi:hypothetical protein